jgi:alpha-glucosidase
MTKYGVDGFKFDGGSLGRYSPENIKNGKQTKYTAEELNIAWNEFGERFENHEYKDTFKRGGKAVIQRIRDRGHRWDDDGICTLLPFAIVEGLTGYPFLCPDMIGGGEWSYTLLGKPWDEELVVRMAECSALFPMMQFSLAPWRILNKENAALCHKAAMLHKKFAPKIIEEVKKAAITGEPIIRPLEYEFPNQGFVKVKDAFMLGSDVLVAPVLEQGAVTKTLRLPTGVWSYLGKEDIEGGKEVTVNAPLGTLPYFIKK